MAAGRDPKAGAGKTGLVIAMLHQSRSIGSQKEHRGYLRGGGSLERCRLGLTVIHDQFHQTTLLKRLQKLWLSQSFV
jgi:hypothetical protein